MTVQKPNWASFQASVEDAISANDRAWFEANSDREYRVRLLFPGERLGLEPPAGFSFVLVCQLGPGVRERRRLASPISPPFLYVDPSGADWEVTARAALPGSPKSDRTIRTGGVDALSSNA